LSLPPSNICFGQKGLFPIIALIGANDQACFDQRLFRFKKEKARLPNCRIENYLLAREFRDLRAQVKAGKIALTARE
jgi:hypothetical protein